MLSEKLKQLADTFANAVAEAVDAEMRHRMTAAINTLGSGGESHEDSGSHRAPRATKTPKAAKPGKSGRLARRSLEEIQAVVADVVKLVAKHPDGLRSETIRTELDLDVREVPRVLKEGLSSGALKSKGQKRATVYFAGKGGKSAPKAKKTAKKAKKVSAKPKAKAVKASGKKAAKKTSSKKKASNKSVNGVVGHASPAAEATA
jgi:hypothetical protein